MATSGVILLRNNKAGVSSSAHAAILTGDLPAHGWQNPFPAFEPILGDVLAADLEPTYAFANLAITQKRKELGLYLLSGFEFEAERKDFEILCGGDGCVLLALLYARAAQLTPAEINTIKAEMSLILHAGLRESSVAELSRFRTEYEKKNACLPRSSARTTTSS